MGVALRRINKGLRGAWGHLLHGYPLSFDPGKQDLIDRAFGGILPTASSFADLGGVWRVDGAYTFYTLKHYPMERACLVDTDLNEVVKRRQQRHANLKLIPGNFGETETIQRIGHVDAVYFFDVLLHQVSPNWDQVLKLYAGVTDCMIIFNQQLVEGEKTLRLVDLGFEKYFEYVRMNPRSPLYRNLVEKTDEIHPDYQRPWRDIHNVWQWGITDADLVATMTALGFQSVYVRNHGQFGNFEKFENHAFIFQRR